MSNRLVTSRLAAPSRPGVFSVFTRAASSGVTRVSVPVKVVKPVYVIHHTEALKDHIAQASKLKLEIDKYRNFDVAKAKRDAWKRVNRWLALEWTAQSNQLEGSQLSSGESQFFVEFGMKVKGKPEADFVRASRHMIALQYLDYVVGNDRPISHQLVKEFTVLLSSGNLLPDAHEKSAPQAPAKPAVPETTASHVVQPDGTLEYYADPKDVAGHMTQLCHWINEIHLTDRVHPIHAAAIAHYNTAYADGRVARIMFNFCLMRKGYPPTIIQSSRRKEYVDAWQSAETGNLTPFAMFGVESLVDTQKEILRRLRMK